MNMFEYLQDVISKLLRELEETRRERDEAIANLEHADAASDVWKRVADQIDAKRGAELAELRADLARVTAERDEARAEVKLLRGERDEAWEDLRKAAQRAMAVRVTFVTRRTRRRGH